MHINSCARIIINQTDAASVSTLHNSCSSSLKANIFIKVNVFLFILEYHEILVGVNLPIQELYIQICQHEDKVYISY